MPIPGYDPEDVDEKLESLMAERDPSNWLTPAERREYEAGASLVDLLDEEDIRDLLRSDGADVGDADATG